MNPIRILVLLPYIVNDIPVSIISLEEVKERVQLYFYYPSEPL